MGDIYNEGANSAAGYMELGKVIVGSVRPSNYS
jgi:hypothetical protein